MDGYAVRAADTAPGVALRLAGGVAAGEVAAVDARARHRGARSRPARRCRPGADAMLQSELALGTDGHVAPERALAPGTHVRYRGEDLHAGDVLARAGRAADAAAAVRARVGRRRRGRRCTGARACT